MTALTEARATGSAEAAKWDGLRPRNVVQAAVADMARRKLNDERSNNYNSDIYGDRCEPYAFMREHVRDADGAFGLIQTALDAVLEDKAKGEQELVKKVTTNKAGKTIEKWIDPSLHGRIRRSTKSATMLHLYVEPLLRAALELERAS